MRRVAPALAIIPLVVLSFLGGYWAGRPDYLVGPYEGRGIQVQLEVYKNGKLVYVDHDDPATKNFLLLFGSWLFVVTEGANGNVVKEDGTTTNLNLVYDMSTLGSVVVEVSDGAGNFSRTMYVLPGNVYRALVSDSNVVVGDNFIQVSGSITMTTSTNITWVGLSWVITSEANPQPNNMVLIFADELSTPIQVNANDVITVVYKIVVP